MTREVRETVELTDLEALEVECGRCKTIVAVPIEGTGAPERNLPNECPHCSASLCDSDDRAALKELVDQVRQIPKRNMKAGVRFRLRQLRSPNQTS